MNTFSLFSSIPLLRTGSPFICSPPFCNSRLDLTFICKVHRPGTCCVSPASASWACSFLLKCWHFLLFYCRSFSLHLSSATSLKQILLALPSQHFPFCPHESWVILKLFSAFDLSLFCLCLSSSSCLHTLFLPTPSHFGMLLFLFFSVCACVHLSTYPPMYPPITYLSDNCLYFSCLLLNFKIMSPFRAYVILFHTFIRFCSSIFYWFTLEKHFLSAFLSFL